MAEKRAHQERLGHGTKEKVKNSFSHHASYRLFGGLGSRSGETNQIVTELYCAISRHDPCDSLVPVSEYKVPAVRPRPRRPHTTPPISSAGGREAIRGPVGLAQGWYHFVDNVVAAVSKNHTPPRLFERVHHHAAHLCQMSRTAANKTTSACTICRGLRKPPSVYNNHSVSQCPLLEKHRALLHCSKKEQLIILKDALMKVLEKQEEDILQGPVNPSS